MFKLTGFLGREAGIYSPAAFSRHPVSLDGSNLEFGQLKVSGPSLVLGTKCTFHKKYLT